MSDIDSLEDTLQDAVEAGNTTLVVETLAAGADVEVNDGYCLFHASRHGHTSMVQSLLAANANKGLTLCLEVATSNGYFLTAAALLEGGAHTTESALEYASRIFPGSAMKRMAQGLPKLPSHHCYRRCLEKGLASNAIALAEELGFKMSCGQSYDWAALDYLPTETRAALEAWALESHIRSRIDDNAASEPSIVPDSTCSL